MSAIRARWRSARRLFEVLRCRRFGLVRTRERILHFRQRHGQLRHERLRLRGRFVRRGLELRQDLRRRQQGPSPGVKGGYFPVPPVDSQQDIRTAMSIACEEMGLKFEVHHHEVATAGQGEINVAANTLTKKADEVQILKYALAKRRARLRQDADLHAEAHRRRQRQRHARASIPAEGRQGAVRRGQVRRPIRHASYYIGGIIKHARAINAFTNASTNSYKRLVPGFEAPVKLAYSARNRSASIRIPWIANPKGRRIEVRFPDATGNPYFMFASMLLAGIDGIQNKIHPGDPADKDLYDSGARGGQEDSDGLSLARHGARLPRQGSRPSSRPAACSPTI
jgi:glutamine synthetase